MLFRSLFYGNPHQLFVQLIAVLVIIIYSALFTFIIYKVVDIIIGMRVSEKEEAVGLDLSQHHEGAYTVLE